MYTHLYVTPENAEKLFDAFARKSLGLGESGAVTHASFEKHFNDFPVTYLADLGASLERSRPNKLFFLQFSDYLAHTPQALLDLEIEPVKVTIRRFNSAPTKARAGYYEDVARGFSATVERIFPIQQDQSRRPVPLYAQNIVVSAPTLKAVQEANTKLSLGQWNRFLVNAFE